MYPSYCQPSRWSPAAPGTRSPVSGSRRLERGGHSLSYCSVTHYLKCCCTERCLSFVFVRLFEDIGHWMHRRNNQRLLVASTNEYGRRTGLACNSISVNLIKMGLICVDRLLWHNLRPNWPSNMLINPILDSSVNGFCPFSNQISGRILDIWPYIQQILDQGNRYYPKIGLITDLVL